MAFHSGLPPTPPIQDFDEYQKPGLVLPTHIDGSKPLYPLPPASRQNSVLAEDLKTPDNYVERDPRLIRLTGVHPFNVEAPLSDLYDEGFLTTKDLHYVRNHGAVPRVEDSECLDWEFTIEGMVSNPIKMTLRDLIQTYDQVTYPITLVCAGNRRKEQNVVRKTKGFSWGAAGLSTALWTGVTLPDLLARAGPKRGAKYVCFEGADKLPNGYYGTSVKLNWAMDPDRGMMVAHRMNGEALPPDHGKPLRIVIPGQIGGRSVKWLKRIIVTSKPSENWYHIYDNRVLPGMISPEDSANLPETWKDERYAIYDLNTNSAICYPAHNETVPLTGGAESYKLKGYAYAGGGKRVTRLEVTLDQGRTWMLATVSYPEDLYRLAPDGEVLFGGRLDMAWRESCFCWCFWELDLPLSRLQEAGDVMIRAMDDSMMVQPRDMYWSVLGMMNNPWYRVVIHKEAHSLRFEHPTQPALMPGGWMERVKKEGGNITNGFWGEKMAGEDAAPAQEAPAKEISMVDETKVARKITADELRQHSGDDEPWFVVNGHVYDGTKFLEGHPGGAASIINAAGQDVSEEFLAIRKPSPSSPFPTLANQTPLTAPHHRQRKRQSNDAHLPPRRPLSAPLRRRRLRRAHLPSRRPGLPLPQDLAQGPPDARDPRLPGHQDLHLHAPLPFADRRPPRGAAPHGPPARPRHARGRHPRVHAALGRVRARGAERADQDLPRRAGHARRQDDAGPGLAAAGARGRVQGPRGEVRVPRPGPVHDQRQGEEGRPVRDGLRRERDHAHLGGAAGRDEG